MGTASEDAPRLNERLNVSKPLNVSKNFQKLARSISKDNMALLPLQKVSTTLQDVKRNGETLMLTVGQKLKGVASIESIDDSMLRRLGNMDGSRPKVRKSASETNIAKHKHKQFRTMSSVPKHTTAQGTESFDWLSAFNDTINQARESTRPKFQLPSRSSLEHQAKQLVHSASSMRLEQVASQIMEKPKEALNSAQATLSTCQQNFQALQVTLQQSFVEGKAVVEQKIQTLGEPGSPSSSGNRLAALLGPSKSASRGANDSSTQSLPAYLQSLMRREPVEELPTKGETSGDDIAGPLLQPWGPFQQQAQRRRRESGRRSGSSLREEGRQVTIVTTAALPWMTGTAVNPLLRAAYLARDGARSVTLMIPWLAKSDQQRVFPNNITFETPKEQEQWVRDWARKRTGFDSDYSITFYPGRYAPEKCSVLPVGDPTAYVPEHSADVAILEEPEHLTWYHHGRRWTDKFSHVVGVVHTNYLDYARREEGGAAKEALLRHINAWVTRIHCHKVVKLSDAVQDLPRQTTQFVHGVADTFLRVGEEKALLPANGSQRFPRGAYFLGKCVWAKGYTELLDLLSQHAKSGSGNPMPVDCFGTGEDLDAVKTEAERRRLGLQFHGARDHLDKSLHDYRVFVNPSTSDVVATTTAEALAMGKWVVCAEHPSNAFFTQFKNCLIYRTPEEFSKHMRHALEVEPAPITAEDRERLTWEAATERFLDVTELAEKDLAPGPVVAAADAAAWAAHNSLCGFEALRTVAGAGINTRDNPPSLAEYQPANDLGGLFDDKRRSAKAYKNNATRGTQAQNETRE